MSGAFELIRRALFDGVSGHPDPDHALFNLKQIEQAVNGLPIDVIRTVGPDAPLGRIQRRMLHVLWWEGPWDPTKESSTKTHLIPYVNAANGLVARGFAVLNKGVYVITDSGEQESKKRWPYEKAGQ